MSHLVNAVTVDVDHNPRNSRGSPLQAAVMDTQEDKSRQSENEREDIRFHLPQSVREIESL
jgi:hypothetical protein